MKKIKCKDQVIVITGKDKGKQGIVLKRCKFDRILVEGVNLVKKHMKGNPNEQKAGGIIQKEAPLHISNVALVNPATGKAEKVGIKTLEDGRKVRYFKSNGEVVDV